ncbi:hypothetical protein L1987_06905 [Smallanthus sonchifolius]|uniref:Uncharacterized protein n=1 Tax=Smallanthus sonchifolius TaxID=185202 RepID=A0ACB9JZF5_9ASTR|nr:hypothetical protein L1987_06905 [Smallanthus sonchifolius]
MCSTCNLFLTQLTQSGLINGFWRKCWCRAVDSFDYHLLNIGLESKHQLAFINLFGSIAINFGTNFLKLGNDEPLSLTETFLELLDPYILKYMLGSLPPEIKERSFAIESL